MVVEGDELIKDLLQEFPDIKIIATAGGGSMPPQLYPGLADGLGLDKSQFYIYIWKTSPTVEGLCQIVRSS